MQRYEIQLLENGTWAVIDCRNGKPVNDPSGYRKSTRLEAQALADFRNGIAIPLPSDRISTRLQTLRRAWGMLSARRQD